MRKIILVDIYLAYNLGDDMFLDYLAKYFPDVDFIPFHPGKNYSDFFNNYQNVKQFPYSILDKLKARFGKNKLKDYEWMSENFDGLLFLGGGIFREESYWKELYQYRNDILKAFKTKSKPVWFAGCSFGPFQSNEFFNTYKNLFGKVDKITFRDKHSFGLFSDLPNVSFAPDLLWSFPLPQTDKEEKHLGISLINPNHKKGLEHIYEKYIKAHLSIIEDYQQNGFKISLFSFCDREGDTEIANVILKTFPNCRLFIYDGTINTYLKEIGKCSHFIAARFHANIISMKNNQWLIPIIYGNKTSNLLNDIEEKGIHLKNIELLTEFKFIKVTNFKIEKNITNSTEHLNFKM
jgi:colanic acid/amylovoran biosynthesis protein